MPRTLKALNLLLSAAVSVSAAGAQVGAACRPTEGVTVEIRDYIIDVVTATDSATTAFRDSISLPNIVADSVTIVSDSTTCAAAANAYARVDETDPSPTIYKVWVIKVGSGRYVIFNPERGTRFAGFWEIMIFDVQFNFKKAIVS